VTFIGFSEFCWFKGKTAVFVFSQKDFCLNRNYDRKTEVSG